MFDTLNVQSDPAPVTIVQASQPKFDETRNVVNKADACFLQKNNESQETCKTQEKPVYDQTPSNANDQLQDQPNEYTCSFMAEVDKIESGYLEQRNSFVDYLIQTRHPSGRQIKKAKIHRLCMRWRTQFNHVDCGVFIMRHMETYRGNGLLYWDCGLCNEYEVNNAQKNQLNDLRRKYTTKIILHDINSRKFWVLKDIKAYIQLPIEVRRAADDTSHENIASRLNEHAD
ncbi:hypothetical protein R6Q57_001479 [Mikania cordata]